MANWLDLEHKTESHLPNLFHSPHGSMAKSDSQNLEISSMWGHFVLRLFGLPTGPAAKLMAKLIAKLTNMAKHFEKGSQALYRKPPASSPWPSRNSQANYG
ncbi:hypothetical protein MKX08_001371 [Trichoderma sp. CBMAI-0020]|nr:hypothetical protein MKX08_001371 [Trichoderma sp. CBMAI-0020]